MKKIYESPHIFVVTIVSQAHLMELSVMVSEDEIESASDIGFVKENSSTWRHNNVWDEEW